MAKFTENIEKAQKLLNSKKEQINEKKQTIALTKARKEDCLKSIEEERKKVQELGYDPDKIPETLQEIKEQGEKDNQELEDIINELKALDI